LAGQLIPLKGGAPINTGFVSGNHDPASRLQGNGSAFLDSNRLSSADPLDNFSLCAWVVVPATNAAALAGVGANDSGASSIVRTSANALAFRNRTVGATSVDGAGSAVGFIGTSRSLSTGYNLRVNGSTQSVAAVSQAPAALTTKWFHRDVGVPTDAGLAFCAVGEAITMSALEARLSTLFGSLVWP
jgi:hypothetical protein